jgi:hypothetical protein
MAASQVRLLLTHAPMPPLLLSIFALAAAVELSMTSGNRMPLSPAIPQHATPLSITPLLNTSITLPHDMPLSIRRTQAYLQHLEATAVVAAASPILLALHGT